MVWFYYMFRKAPVTGIVIENIYIKRHIFIVLFVWA